MSQKAETCAPRCAPTSPPSPSVSLTGVNTYFRILRFVAAHPHLFAEPTVAATPTAPATADATIGPSPLPSAPALISESGATGSPFRIPSVLEESLDAYRRMATTRPINAESLEAARVQVWRMLEELCSKAGDAAAAAALHDDVCAPEEEDVLVESDSTTSAKPLWNISWGPQYAGNGRRVCNRDEMQRIVPGLWCGSWRPASNLAVLRRCGITHVCCCIGTRPHFPADLVYWSIPADDTPTYKIEPYFDQAYEFIDSALVGAHGNVLVHCGAGISRAPTIVASYLMKRLHISSTAAVELIQCQRSVASPNSGFREQLREYGRKLKAEAVSRRISDESESDKIIQ